MTRHTSNRHNNKSHLAEWLPAPQAPTSGYQVLSYWMMVMVGLLSVGLLFQRFRGVMPANAVSQLSPAVTLSCENSQLSHEIQFPGLAPLLLGSALAYQSGNSVIGLLGSLPLWFVTPVAAQTRGVSSLGPEFRVNSNMIDSQAAPAVASTGAGEWVVVWTSGQQPDFDIHGQRYAANGNVAGSEFRVNSNVTRDQQNPAVASISTGEWVVVWEGLQTGSTDIYAQRYAMNGSVLGSEFRVNSNVMGPQSFPAVASLSTGEWVVVWQGDQTGNNDIYAQRYAMNGSALGSEFRVNSNVTGQQQYPTVSSLSTGEWVVMWQGAQTGNTDIYAQRYAMSGSALGSEFRVNSNTTGSQFNPALASRSAEEWVVMWVNSQAGDADIYAQRYAINGSVLGSEFRVNSNTTGNQASPAVASTSAKEWVAVWVGSQTAYNVYGSIFLSTDPLLSSTSPASSTSVTASTLLSTAKTTQLLGTTPMQQQTDAVTTTQNQTANTSSSSTSVAGSTLLSTQTVAVTTTQNQTPSTASASTTTLQQVTEMDTNSGVSVAVIGAAAGAGGFGLAVCLGAMGFYACKKTRAKQANNAAVNQAGGVPLRAVDHYQKVSVQAPIQTHYEEGILALPSNATLEPRHENAVNAPNHYQLAPPRPTSQTHYEQGILTA